MDCIWVGVRVLRMVVTGGDKRRLKKILDGCVGTVGAYFWRIERLDRLLV